MKRFAVKLVLMMLLIANPVIAAITFTGGEWSTSFGGVGCTEGKNLYNTQYPEDAAHSCDLLSNGGNRNTISCTYDSMVTSDSNNPLGSGKGVKHCIESGKNYQGGTFQIKFANGAQTEYWVRFYIKYPNPQSTWNYLQEHKLMWNDYGSTGYATAFSLSGNEVRFWNQGLTPETVSSTGSKGWPIVGDGNWHCLEYHIKAGSSGHQDAWVDNVQVINQSIALTNDSSRGWDFIEVMTNADNVGSGTHDVLVDDIAISLNGRIGPLSVSGLDITPPVVSSGSPSGTLPYGTTSSNMTVTTNEAATCKYGTSNVAYASLPNTFTTTGGTSHSRTLSGLTNGSSYNYYVRCIDGSGNANTSSTAISFNISATGSSDNIPPTISSGSPSGTLSYGTTSANMTVTTNEAATCKYGTSNVAYASLPNTFTTTGGTSHSRTLSGLTNGSSYNYYVRCIDGSGNANTSSTAISFNISSDSIPPTISSGSPSGTLSYGTTSANMTVTTNEAATCKYGTSNVAYASLPNTFTTTGGTSHSRTLSGLTNGSSYNYYVRCIDGSGNANTSSTAISFNISSDSIPPTISSGSPSGTLSYGTTSANMTVTTNEAATCKYGTSNVAYASLPNTFTTTGGTSHSMTLSGLTNGGSYNYYVRCIDGSGNSNTSGTPVAFNVSNSQPPSSSLLFSEDFENSNFTSRGWYDGAMTALTTTTPQNGTHAAQFTFSQGASSPSAPYAGAMRHLFTATDQLYVSYYIKFATGWRGSQKPYHPHQIFILSDLDDDYAGMAYTHLTTYIEFISDIGSPYIIRPQLAIQDGMRVNYSAGNPPNNLSATTENRSVGYCNSPVSSGATGDCFDQSGNNKWWSAATWKSSNTNVSTNGWHHVEAYFKMNTISGGKGQHDGIMQKWINGVQVIDQRDIMYRTNQDASKKWHQFVIAPYIGDGSPITQTFYIDNLNVYNGLPDSSSLTPVRDFRVLSTSNP